jgi:large subunit ribosomal protein L16
LSNLIQPQKYVHSKTFKRRLGLHIKIDTFSYGSIALVIGTPLLLTATNLGRIQLKLKRSCAKKDKTYRKFWIRAFPSFPLTRKSTNARMGKGKGKLKGWFCRITAGSFFIELKNVRIGRGRFFLNQIRSNLRSSDFVTFRTPTIVTSQTSRKRSVKLVPYF